MAKVEILLYREKIRTWVHVWKQPAQARQYWNYNWNTKKWEKPTGVAGYINPAKSFIEADGIISDSDLTAKFKGLQKYLTRLPRKFNAKQIEQNYGYASEAEYRVGYQQSQVGRVNSAVAPFTLLNAANIELNSSGDIFKEMLDKAGLGEWKEYLNSDDFSAEQLEQLKEQVRQEFESHFEAITKINDTITRVEDALAPEAYLELRDNLEDTLEGMAGDGMRDLLSDTELPGFIASDSICEIQ